jgi:TolB-like protein
MVAMHLLTLIAALSCLLGGLAAPANGAQPAGPSKRQVIFLPFDIQIPGSYAYLRNGLANTLASRLANRANIAAVAQGVAAEQMAKALQSGDHAMFSQQLRQSGADYLIMGSLAPKAGQLELTSYVFSQGGGQGAKKFQQSFQSVDDAMTAVDELAWTISGAVFGKPKPEAMATGSTSTTGMAAFQTAHPERAYREGLFSGSATGLEAGGPFELVGSYRSKGIPAEPMDINGGDLDGDGTEEIVLLTSSALMLYRNEEGHFRMLATLDLPKHLRYHAVTLGDLNNNGLQELYISASNGDRPDTSILEWNGKKITTLAEHLSWYLRTMTAPNTPVVLVGQKDLAEEFGGGVISQLSLDTQGRISEGKQLNLPQGINLFDFTQADLDGDGRKETIALNNSNRLQVYDASGSLRWTSTEIHGASNNFFGTLTSTNNAVNSEKETAWVRTRIVISDLDLNGTNDVLVGRNRLETVSFMPNLRYFDGSSLAAYTWKDGALNRLWETKKIPAYITNYQCTRTQRDSGQYQIIFAEAESSYPFVFWNAPTTYLNSYTLRVNTAAK